MHVSLDQESGPHFCLFFGSKPFPAFTAQLYYPGLPGYPQPPTRKTSRSPPHLDVSFVRGLLSRTVCACSSAKKLGHVRRSYSQLEVSPIISLMRGNGRHPPPPGVVLVCLVHPALKYLCLPQVPFPHVFLPFSCLPCSLCKHSNTISLCCSKPPQCQHPFAICCKPSTT